MTVSITYYGGVISPRQDTEYDTAPDLESGVKKARAALQARGWTGTSATITADGRLRAHLSVSKSGRVICKRSH